MNNFEKLVRAAQLESGPNPVTKKALKTVTWKQDPTNNDLKRKKKRKGEKDGESQPTKKHKHIRKKEKGHKKHKKHDSATDMESQKKRKKAKKTSEEDGTEDDTPEEDEKQEVEEDEVEQEFVEDEDPEEGEEKEEDDDASSQDELSDEESEYLVPKYPNFAWRVDERTEDGEWRYPPEARVECQLEWGCRSSAFTCRLENTKYQITQLRYLRVIESADFDKLVKDIPTLGTEMDSRQLCRRTALKVFFVVVVCARVVCELCVSVCQRRTF